MNEFPKIPAVFKRQDTKPHAIIPGKFRDPAVEYLKDTMWWWSEKLDGTNVRIMWDGCEVQCRGRTDRAQFPPDLKEHLSWYEGEEFEAVLEQTFGAKPVTIYGEGIGPKIQKGGGGYGATRFVMFDVCIDGWWVAAPTSRNIADALGIEHVLPYFTEPVPLTEVIQFVRTEGVVQSTYHNTGVAEGLVGQPAYPVRHPAGSPIKVKIKAHELG